MSESLNDQVHFQNDGAPEIDAPMEQQPDAAGVGRAQRSEPERSDGERSAARPPNGWPSLLYICSRPTPPASVTTSRRSPLAAGLPSPSLPAPPTCAR